MNKSVILAVVIWALLAMTSQPTLSETVTANTRSQIVKAVEEAKPGTTILIAPGTYQGGLHFNGLRGEQGKPIILTAADKTNLPVFQGNNSCFHLTDPAFVELHALILTEASGNGINIDDGASYESPAHHDLSTRAICVADIARIAGQPVRAMPQLPKRWNLRKLQRFCRLEG